MTDKLSFAEHKKRDRVKAEAQRVIDVDTLEKHHRQTHTKTCRRTRTLERTTRQTRKHGGNRVRSFVACLHTSSVHIIQRRT